MAWRLLVDEACATGATSTTGDGAPNVGDVRHNRRVKSNEELATLAQRTLAALEGARLPLDLPGADELEESRARLITQLRTRVLPHLENENLPVIVVLGGSSGAGKSTLFNSLVGREISPASVLRPTTRMPVIAMHPVDAPYMRGHALLELGRAETLPGAIPGVVLVDAPDLDSVEEHNRELARRLLDAADLWIFVTTPSRYGDSYSWDVLRDAYARGASTAVVINRLTRRAEAAVVEDLTARLRDAGLGQSPLLTVADAGPHEGLLTARLVDGLRARLLQLASSGYANTLADTTTAAMLPGMAEQLETLSEAVDMQATVIDQLKGAAATAAGKAAEELRGSARRGKFGSGAPTAAWLTAASSGGVLAGVSAEVGPRWLQRGAQARRDAAMTAVFSAAQDAIAVALRAALEGVADSIAAAWQDVPLDVTPLVERARDELNLDAAGRRALDAWRSTIKGLVADSVPAHHPWFGPAGRASLLGTAASGVSGAERIARDGLGATTVREAREDLAERLAGAVDGVVDTYVRSLGSVAVGNGRELRLRAAEFSENF